MTAGIIDRGTSGAFAMDRSILDKLVTEVRHFHNRDFLKAAMAVCALAAVADDEVALVEHHRIDEVLATDPALRELDADKAIETLYEYLRALRTYGRSADQILRNKVRRMAGKHKRARTLMRVAYLVITADGQIREQEREEFRRLCNLLGLEPQQVWRELES